LARPSLPCPRGERAVSYLPVQVCWHSARQASGHRIPAAGIRNGTHLTPDGPTRDRPPAERTGPSRPARQCPLAFARDGVGGLYGERAGLSEPSRSWRGAPWTPLWRSRRSGVEVAGSSTRRYAARASASRPRRRSGSPAWATEPDGGPSAVLGTHLRGKRLGTPRAHGRLTGQIPLTPGRSRLRG
jgi:hypothetical protein